MRYLYAQIDGRNVCFALLNLSGAVAAPGMLVQAAFDPTLLGMAWQGGAWIATAGKLWDGSAWV